MASNILNVLENVEKGRQNCIKNAKLANLPATDDMDIFNIGNLFLEQNNTEFIKMPNKQELCLLDIVLFLLISNTFY